jgi:hypothetical protein
MLLNNWRAEAARIAAGMYDIDLDRVSKAYLWRLFGDDVSPWEVAELAGTSLPRRRPSPTRPIFQGGLSGPRAASRLLSGV